MPLVKPVRPRHAASLVLLRQGPRGLETLMGRRGMSAPFMQLYIGDYLRDTSGLTTEAHGAYLLILFAMCNADGWVSAEPRKLAQYARMTVARWAKIAPDIVPFLTIEEGMATQGRLLKQLEKASGKSLARKTKRLEMSRRLQVRLHLRGWPGSLLLATAWLSGHSFGKLHQGRYAA